MAITMEQIKDLRGRTGAGVVDAKQALEASNGDVEKAILWLREKGKATVAKKSVRETKEGAVATYVHGNKKMAVLVALLCETDFVARNEKFQELARNIAMHIAASDPLVVKPEEVSDTDVEAEKEFAKTQLAKEGKPADMIGKIIDGKMKKFREERALLTQVYVKDPKMTIEQLIAGAVAELGENISVQEFKKISI
ncbi:MAG: elongation factor Ts [Candidatus Andersenbacteria bacterium RIFCSPHIGHO2_12_FULL_45_11b]|uniref:Elongation factor Ts n=1 Tax=Candidatus Andersenbacteria bacterium RIFCSPHIGHO2_12_FULL_45_11b TaxID=1797282 RepID=A0A1G1XBS0_9BACT|nr:MAG: elongation factor Ts [Candidatus Andersenbacteria bacterium RIFCSPHIGHO2_12_FULL_45_11b]